MITPLLHRIVIKLDPVEDVSAGGIVIPKQITDKERKAIEIGEVISIGPTAFKDYGGGTDTISIGDRVIIARYSGKEVTDDNVKYVIVNDEDVLCIQKEEK